jgi:hypothetical protein
MNLARRQLGYTMEDVWQRLPEAQFSAGVYDSGEQRIFPQDHLDSMQQERVLNEVMRGAQVMSSHESSTSQSFADHLEGRNLS